MLVIVALIAAAVALLARTWDVLFAWAGDHADAARVIVVGLGLFILVMLGLGWAAVIFAAIVTGLGLVAVHYCARRRAPPLPVPSAL